MRGAGRIWGERERNSRGCFGDGPRVPEGMWLLSCVEVDKDSLNQGHSLWQCDCMLSIYGLRITLCSMQGTVAHSLPLLEFSPAQAAPDCWQLPGAADSLLRTLPPLLRDSWRGAGPVCWPALLPFLTLLPWQLNPSAADTQQQQQQQQQPIQGRATAAEGESAEGAKRSGKGSKKGQGQVEQVGVLTQSCCFAKLNRRP